MSVLNFKKNAYLQRVFSLKFIRRISKQKSFGRSSLGVFLIPFYFLLLIFIIDRIIGSELVRKFTETRAEYYFYHSRESLFEFQREEIRNNPESFPVFVLGTSHLGELSTDIMRARRPDLVVYNYSAPYPSYTYFQYILQKGIKSGLTPKMIFLELTPISLEDRANEYPLKYSYDWSYILSRPEWKPEEIDLFIRSNLFLSGRFPFRGAELLKRIKHPELIELFQFVRGSILQFDPKKRGGISNDLLVRVPEEKLISESDEYFRRSLEHMEFSGTQYNALRDILELCRKENIRIIGIEPILFPYLAIKFRRSKIGEVWEKKIEGLREEYNFIHIQLQNHETEMNCMEFIDPHHLSGKCYTSLTEIIFSSIPE